MDFSVTMATFEVANRYRHCQSVYYQLVIDSKDFQWLETSQTCYFGDRLE